MKLFLPLALCIVSLGSAVAQQRPATPQQQQEADAQAVTLQGCLTKGSSDGQFVISDSKSGQKITFNGSPRLATYLNHTVELTGKMMDQNGERTFQATAIKSLASTCQGAS
jgi:hypothetical protein